MRLLGETTALLRIEVHIVHIERRGRQRLGRRLVGYTDGRLGILAVLPRLEVYVDTNLVVLQGDEGNRKARITAEPELQRDIEGLRGRTGTGNARNSRLRARACRIKTNARRTLHEHKVMRVADKGLKGANGTRLRGELGPNLHPVAVLAVNTLTTNLNLDLLHKAVPNVIEPTETLRNAGIAERGGR